VTRAEAIAELDAEVAARFRFRPEFSACRGTRSRSKATALRAARLERQTTIAICMALRALRATKGGAS
jgi:hypothetical protein